MAKLHFYSVQKYGEPKFYYEEVEAVDKPKTYMFKDRNDRPDGFYGQMVKKSEIGHIIETFGPYLFLETKDHNRAKELFSLFFDREIRAEEKKLNALLSRKQVVVEFKED